MLSLPVAEPAPTDLLTTSLILDTLQDHEPLAALQERASARRAEGYEVFLATNPQTGRMCIWGSA